VAVRVLIVDDQASFRRAARNVVELTEGFDLAGEVSSGEDSVEAARSMRPDLVLMDVRLPRIDGLEACRRILDGNAVGGSPPVIILVSADEPAEPSEWLDRCGAAAYVAKSEFGSERLMAVWTSATGSV
jgi:DNA-binding NarL/FixJ family response regulator